MCVCVCYDFIFYVELTLLLAEVNMCLPDDYNLVQVRYIAKVMHAIYSNTLWCTFIIIIEEAKNNPV